MSETALREAAPLQALALRHLRRRGAERADLSSFDHDGETYRMRVDRPCRLDVHLVTMEQITGQSAGMQRSLAAVSWDRRDRHDVQGLALLMDALTNGIALNATGDPPWRSWRVLPHIWVPSCYTTDATDAQHA